MDRLRHMDDTVIVQKLPLKFLQMTHKKYLLMHVCVCISVSVKFEMVTLKRCVLRRLLLNDLFTHSWHLKTEEASKQTEAINSTRNSMSNIRLYKP